MKAKIAQLIKDKFSMSVFILFFIGLFLRLFRIDAFVTFLGDQGRDAIVIKRILTFEHFPAIGPPTSIGQVYLGPFYYYFIAPWLWFSNFDPIGPAIGVAIISSIFIILCYIAIKDIFDKKTAIFTAIMITFSTIIIEYSRFSWNPNLLPYFAFLFFYFIYKSQQKHKILWYLLAGAFLSFSIQLHYLALFLIPPTVIFFLVQLLRNRKKIFIIVKGSLLMFSSFIFFSLPLLIFDLRHDFLNFNNFISLSKSSSGVGTDLINTIFESFHIFNSYVFNTQLNTILVYIILFALFAFLIFSLKKKTSISSLLIFFLVTFVGIAIYGGQKFPHYFETVYILYFAVVSYFLAYVSDIKNGRLLIFVFFILYLYINFLGYTFLYKSGNFQIKKAKDVAILIFDNVKASKFTVTSLPGDYSDTTYRYFLEIWGRKPIDKDSLEKADEQFVICERECKPIGDPQWDIAYFGANKQVGVWTINNVKIYKLIRE